jgi:hypothetical protein
MSDYNTSAIIESSLENVNALREHLEKISDLRNKINETLDEVRQVPAHFDKLGVQLSETSDHFVYKNYELLKEQIIFLQEKIIDLNNRIAQIDEIDFRRRFENASTDYFQNLEKISTEKLNQFDQVKNNLSTTNQYFTVEVDRLKTVNLEDHFNKHDKRLADIFGAVNNINTSFLNISNQTMLFQEKLSNIDLKLQTVENRLSVQERNLLSELNTIKESQLLTVKKQNSNFTFLTLLIVVAILATIAMHFIK